MKALDTVDRALCTSELPAVAVAAGLAPLGLRHTHVRDG